MKWVKVLLGAIGFVVVSEAANMLCSIATMPYYIDPNNFAIWSKVMMPMAGPPPATFYVYSIAFALISGIIYSYVYARTNRLLSGKPLQKGAKYGLALFFVAGIPFFLTNYLLINLPLGLLLWWLAVDGLVVYVVGGIAIAKLSG